MKIVIESARPELTEIIQAKTFEFQVKHWNVSGYTWDGKCMCTKKTFDLKIYWPFLDCGRKTMEGLVKKKTGLS